MGATHLFEFHFRAPLNDDNQILLERATGMTISFADYGNSPGRGYLGPRERVAIYLDEFGGPGRDPDSWFIEAWTHHPDDYDREAVDEVAQKIRQVLPQIAEWWEEVPRDEIRR